MKAAESSVFPTGFEPVARGCAESELASHDLTVSQHGSTQTLPASQRHMLLRLRVERREEEKKSAVMMMMMTMMILSLLGFDHSKYLILALNCTRY